MSLQPSKKKKRKKERKEKQKQILVKVDYFWKIVFQRSRASSSVFIFHEKQRNAVRIRYTSISHDFVRNLFIYLLFYWIAVGSFWKIYLFCSTQTSILLMFKNSGVKREAHLLTEAITPWPGPHFKYFPPLISPLLLFGNHQLVLCLYESICVLFCINIFIHFVF